MRMPRPRKRNVGPLILAMVGVGIMVTGIAMHWWMEVNGYAHRIEWLPQFIGAAIAFAGFYAMDPSGAKDGGGFLVEAGTKIVGVIRTGKRATDPVVTVTKSIEPEGSTAVELPLDQLTPPKAPEVPPQPEDVPAMGAVPAKERGTL